MKFVCLHCKTKYQIPKEKIAGKSMKMRCRKCGETILVNALSNSEEKVKPTVAPRVAPVVKVTSIEQEAFPDTAAQATKVSENQEAKKKLEPLAVMKTKVASTLKVEEQVHGVTVPQPSADKVTTASRLQKKTIEKPKTAPVARVKSAALPGAKPVSSVKTQLSAKKGEQPVVKPSADLSLNRGGSAQTSSHTPSLPPVAKVQERPPEWHIGVGGNIQGPYRESELVEIYKKQQVDAESFVWRDGMPAWQPLKDIAEFQSLTLESLHPAMPPPHPTSPAEKTASGVSGLTPDAPDIKIHDPQGSLGVLSESDEDSGWFDAKTGGPKNDSADSHSSSLQIPQKTSPLLIAFATAGLVIFGLAGGYFVWGGEKVRVVEKIVEVERIVEIPSTEKTAASLNDSAALTPSEESEALAKSNGAGAPRASARPKGKAAGQKPSVSIPSPISGLEGLSSLSGPSAGPQKKAAKATGGPGLTSAAIQKTVSTHRASVNRRCWQPALQARSMNAASTARVTVTMVVNHEGKVTSSRSSGAVRGYPGLDSCIVSKVKYWRFPRSGKSQTVNVPFIFAAQ